MGAKYKAKGGMHKTSYYLLVHINCTFLSFVYIPIYFNL